MKRFWSVFEITQQVEDEESTELTLLPFFNEEFEPMHVLISLCLHVGFFTNYTTQGLSR